MKERDLWDIPEKDGWAEYLKTSRTEERARKKIKKGRLGKKEEPGEFWWQLVYEAKTFKHCNVPQVQRSCFSSRTPRGVLGAVPRVVGQLSSCIMRVWVWLQSPPRDVTHTAPRALWTASQPSWPETWLQCAKKNVWISHAFFLWRCDPTRVMASSFLRFLDHTERRTIVGRTPLDE